MLLVPPGFARTYKAQAVHFDGTAVDYLTRGAGLTGAADSKLYTFSAWVRRGRPATGNMERFFNGSSALNGGSVRFSVSISADGNSWTLDAYNAAATRILFATAPLSQAVGEWAHLLISVDLTSTSKRWFYVNDVATSPTWTTYTNDTMDFTLPDWSVGAMPDGTTNIFMGDLADVWFGPGTYLDLSVTANRRKFISGSSTPVYLGASGGLPTGTSPSVFLSGALSGWATNKGAGGGFTTHGALTEAKTSPSLGYTAPTYAVVPVHFDGINDVLKRGAGLTGAVDSGLVSCSFWYKAQQASLLQMILAIETALNGGTSRFRIEYQAGNQIGFVGNNSSGTNILLCNSSVGGLSAGTWYHVLFSVDLSNVARRHIYINDVSDYQHTTYTNGSIDFTLADVGIGGHASGINLVSGDIADLWLATGVYIDFSIEANRRKFRDANGYPVDLGEYGELPNGTRPTVFMGGPLSDLSTWQTNRGGGGGFTLTGALTPASTSPSPNYVTPDEYVTYVPDAIHFDGINDWIARAAGLTGAADGKQFTFNAWIKLAGDGVTCELFNGTVTLAAADPRHEIVRMSTNVVQFLCRNGTGTTILNVATSAIEAGVWHHILASFDLTSTSKRHVYVDDVSDLATITTYTNDTMDMTLADWAIGAYPNGTAKNAIDMADVWWSPVYVDLSVEANRRKFRDADGKPVYLGQAGELPGFGVPMVHTRGAVASWHTNKGSGGGYTLHGTLTNALTYPGGPAYEYIARPVYFDGTNDYLTRGANLTGAADSKSGTISVWVNNAYDGANPGSIMQNATTVGGNLSRFIVRRGVQPSGGDHNIEVKGYNAAGTQILNISSSADTFMPGTGWHHFLCSFDLANGVAKIYVDDVLDYVQNIFTNDTIDFTVADHAVGADASGAWKFTGDIADLWFKPGIYVDFTVEANRRLFIDADGNPVPLGDLGELPGLGQPILCLADNEATSWHTNRGSGGGMTLHGTLVKSTTSPSPGYIGAQESIYAQAQVLATMPATPNPTAGSLLTINGENLASYDYVIKDGPITISSFTESDWFTSTADSRSAFVVVKGDLTINSGQVFKPANRKLFTVVYVTGDLVLGGEISMSQRGANHGSVGVAAANIRIANGVFSGVTNPQIPASGAGGASAVGIGVNGAYAGYTGGAGSNGQLGGGGSGAASRLTGADNVYSGPGAAGTAFSGGAGGGAGSSDSPGDRYADGGDANGGQGGNGVGGHACGGGGGNPGGVHYLSGGVDGSPGTGGTLIVIVEGDLSGSGTMTAAGAAGGGATGSGYAVGGAGSGGGSVTMLSFGSDSSSVAPTALGGSGGDGQGADGGPGGAGTARKLKYYAHSVRFDGNDYLSNGALTGQADSKKMTLSVWVKLMANDDAMHMAFETTSGNADVYLLRSAANKWRILGRNGSNVDVLVVDSANLWRVADGWHHILFSADMAVGAWMYINDVSDIAITTRTDSALDLTPTDSPGWGVGCNANGAESRFNGEMADFMLWSGVSIDLSVEANRRKFITSDGHPVDPSKAIAAFGNPIVMFSDPATATWNVNKGSGGGTFTVTGALADGASSPSD